jgi:hypothetical protein
MDPKKLRAHSRLTRIALGAAGEALEADGPGKALTTGVFLGVTHGSAETLKRFRDDLFEYGPDLGSPLVFSAGVTNAPLCAISRHFGLTRGGTTLIGGGQVGLEILEWAARAVRGGEFDACLAGAVEECSPVVEEVYAQAGLYPGTPPPCLPCPEGPATASGFALSEAGVFFLLEHPRRRAVVSTGPVLTFEPVFDTACEPARFADLVISAAGGGPQDGFELDMLERLGRARSRPVPLIFFKPCFGESFAAGPLVACALACEVLENGLAVPGFPLHPRLTSLFTDSFDPFRVRSVLVVAAGSNGQEAAGLFRWE